MSRNGRGPRTGPEELPIGVAGGEGRQRLGKDRAKRPEKQRKLRTSVSERRGARRDWTGALG